MNDYLTVSANVATIIGCLGAILGRRRLLTAASAARTWATILIVGYFEMILKHVVNPLSALSQEAGSRWVSLAADNLAGLTPADLVMIVKVALTPAYYLQT